MRKRTIYLLLLNIVFSGMLCGCNKGVALTSEQTDIIANYAARTVIRAGRVDFSYKPEIKDKSDNGQEPDTSAEPETDENGNVIDEDKYAPFTDYLKLYKSKISYVGCTVCDEYPADDSALFVMPAERGNKLVVVEYAVHNDTGSNLVYTTANDKPVVRLKVSEDNIVKSFVNVFPNDICNLKDFTVPAGKDANIIVMFQVAEAAANALENIEVMYLYDGKYISLPVEKR